MLQRRRDTANRMPPGVIPQPPRLRCPLARAEARARLPQEAAFCGPPPAGLRKLCSSSSAGGRRPIPARPLRPSLAPDHLSPRPWCTNQARNEMSGAFAPLLFRAWLRGPDTWISETSAWENMGAIVRNDSDFSGLPAFGMLRYVQAKAGIIEANQQL